MGALVVPSNEPQASTGTSAVPRNAFVSDCDIGDKPASKYTGPTLLKVTVVPGGIVPGPARPFKTVLWSKFTLRVKAFSKLGPTLGPDVKSAALNTISGAVTT